MCAKLAYLRQNWEWLLDHFAGLRISLLFCCHKRLVSEAHCCPPCLAWVWLVQGYRFGAIPAVNAKLLSLAHGPKGLKQILGYKQRGREKE